MVSLSSAHAQSFGHRKLAKQARQDFILPGYMRLQLRVKQLRARTVGLCEAPTPLHLKAARGAYLGTIDAWGRVEMITFGPIAEHNRLERIFFWPDRKGIGLRQVRRLLANSRGDPLSAEALAKMSVAVQGLTALEVLLYGIGSSDLATRAKADDRCRL